MVARHAPLSLALSLVLPLAFVGCEGGDDQNQDSTGIADGETAGEEGETGAESTDDGETETDSTAGDDSTAGGETGGGDTDGCDSVSPYIGGWDVGCCQSEVVPGAWQPGGIAPGTVIPDWTMTDQNGDAVRLYDFCHEAIYFEYAAMWCGSCMGHAPEVANLFNTYDDQGLMTLTFMSENAEGGPAAQSDVSAWASTYSHNGLVVYSGAGDVWYPFGEDQGGGSWLISLPGTMLLGPGAVVSKVGVPSISEVEAALPE